MMVQIVEHRAETSVDFAVEGEVASSTPQAPSHSCRARRTTAHGGANIPDSIKGVSGGVVSSQGVIATPSKLHGITRSHEAVAGRR
jgi:hypothetical protein